MHQADVVALYRELEAENIPIWIDGGWAVDALLGEQTREHDDLDVAVRRRDVTRLRERLEAQGWRNRPRDDTSAWNFVLRAPDGRELDVHVFDYDPKIYAYPEGSLAGEGVIGEQRVRCTDPEWLVRFHTGYPLREKDLHDVPALCARFGLELPEAYRGPGCAGS